jgi:hypothetical protein
MSVHILQKKIFAPKNLNYYLRQKLFSSDKFYKTFYKRIANALYNEALSPTRWQYQSQV